MLPINATLPMQVNDTGCNSCLQASRERDPLRVRARAGPATTATDLRNFRNFFDARPS